ncbi:MAG: dimethyl sulfoxide reductase anchor subunit [Gammaproteobacteria bacterium]|nr:dimethyl sulfoxide reductase anchor subunit [Gammaproteobacteria bacterium]
MFKIRSDEPKYAFLSEKESKTTSCYGELIETVTLDDEKRGKSLNINGDNAVGDNPDRYKQHGFYLNADNCIGCHACEVACSEKNDNPAHIAFRSVGFVEGGTYPDYQRLNISMACNHCTDPVCLKGCPTRAYTKFAEYGAVLQDPDICFGCGYCTWVCPYNAPQLDPVKGQVSKCNMCVDRLEVGLKPACVSACLGNALDFGVVESIPENRNQAKTSIPGFPSADITHPNIRFQQTKETQRDMVRPDGMAVKYHKQSNGEFKSAVDEKTHSHNKEWGLPKLLHSHENAHAIFTLSTQAVMGAALWLILGHWFNLVPINDVLQSSAYYPMIGILLALLGYGMFKLNMHLGKPHFFYRGFYNLRHSPVSREIAGVTLFFGGLLTIPVASILGQVWLLNAAFIITVVGFVLGSYYMYKLYRIKARPFWDHWQTASAFYGSVLSLGSLLFGAVGLLFITDSGFIPVLAAVACIGVIVESVGHIVHRKDMQNTGEGQASYFEQVTTFGKTYTLRNVILVINMLALSMLVFLPSNILFVATFISMLVTSYLGRIMFYTLVIPTTMPGAFFWKNKKFSEHAVETGLSRMPQVGVEAERHHKFDVKALLNTVRHTSLKQVVVQVSSIIRG